MPTLPYDTETDSLGVGTQPDAVAAPVEMPPAYRTTDASMAATEPELTAAVGQLNAGQPVTALPHQNWSLDQQRAWNDKLTQYDRQAAATQQAAEQAARDAALLDQMSRVAKSTKDIEVAMQQLDIQRFRNDVANGIPAVQALQRSPRAATAPMVSMVNAQVQPRFVPQSGQEPAHYVTRAGGVAFQPASSMPVAPLSDQGEAILGPDGQPIGYGVQTGPRTRTLVRPPAEGHQGQDVTSAIGILKQQLTQLDRDIADKSVFTTPDAKAQTADLRARRDAVQARILELNPKASVGGTSPAGGKGPTGPIVPVPAKKSDLNTTNFYDIQGAVYRWDGTHFQRVPNAR